MNNFRLLLRLYWQPGAAMSAILDRGSLLFASLAVLAVSLLALPSSLHGGSWLSFSFYTPLLLLAAVYVPGVLILSKLLGGLGGSLGTVFQRDYSSLLTCTAMAWTAANVPLAVAGWFLPQPLLVPMSGLIYLYFAVLMFFAVRTVFETGNGTAIAVVCLSWVPLAVAAFLWGPLSYLLRWVASPFFLFFAFYFLRGELGSLGTGMRGRQNYRRMLEAAAVNPHDGEAQFQLGLIHQQRRQYSEAIQRFGEAVAIDPTQTDAHFQLGRIAREQGRLQDALERFRTVVEQDVRHSQGEILRELGALYITAGQHDDACHQLAEYVQYREYDPEGLYYYGQALEGLGKTAEARQMYERAAEAARTAPHFLRHTTAKWSRMAQKQIRKLRSCSTR